MEKESNKTGYEMTPAGGKKPIQEEQIAQLTAILNKYKSGKKHTEDRIKASEEWWKLRNTSMKKAIQPGVVDNASGWLHNVVASKHADAIEAFPEPVILPREAGDKAEARMLSSVIPCIMEQNHFEETYDINTLRKLRSGSCCYSITWDQSKLNGLGDVNIAPVNILNLFWEPGVEDIQDSAYVFYTMLVDNTVLKQRYPKLIDTFGNAQTITTTKYIYDDAIDTTEKSLVVDCYYHKYVNGKITLQLVKFCNGVCLYASENETAVPVGTVNVTDPTNGAVVPTQQQIGESIAVKGIYDHGKYPFVFDSLFRVEGSICGYGYVDLCKSAQEQIDTMGKAIVDNATANATPRYFSKLNGGINEEEFVDFAKPIVHYTGSGSAEIFPVTAPTLQTNTLNFYNAKIDELRETTGNTETFTGTTSSVTAASAIAALQEASGKISRASTLSAYRCYQRIIEIVIELIRQFYDAPRTFRITGQCGTEQFVQFNNAGLKPQYQGMIGMTDMGYRLPVFDIKVSAQKKNRYTKLAQNEMAIQFYQLGFFNPQNADMSLAVLDMMDFDGKDELMQKIGQNGTIYQKLLLYEQMALTLAQKYGETGLVNGLSQEIMGSMQADQQNGQINMGNITTELPQGDNVKGSLEGEAGIMENARRRTTEATQPK